MYNMMKSLVMNSVDMEQVMSVEDGRLVAWLAKADLKGKVKVLGKEFDNLWKAFDSVAKGSGDERLTLNWMLYVLWQRVQGDKMFWSMLHRLYGKEVVFSCGETVWGCRNKEMEARRREIRRSLTPAPFEGEGEETPEDRQKRMEKLEWQLANLACGTWEGQNKLGKLLKICSECVRTKSQPAIDYAYFDEVGILWEGKRLKFTKK